jgi:hypothetical protein
MDYFVSGDRARLDRIRDAQPALTHPDERFMLDAPTPDYKSHLSTTAGPNVNSVYVGVAELNGRRWPLFFKPLSGIKPTTAHDYRQDSLVDIGIHEVAAWWLARDLGPPWSEIVAPAVWRDPPQANSIHESGPVILGMGGSAHLPEPGVGFDRLISDAAFFDALIASQDRHDENLRAAPGPSLGLIDHGYSFARPRDYHNRYATAGFFQRLRYGQRRFSPPGNPTLDYSGVGPLLPALAPHEQAALARLKADPAGLLGIADLLSEDRADALRDRVQRMDQAQEILRPADF